MNRVKKKLKAIAENMPLVYEAGKAEGGNTEEAYNQGVEAGKQAEREAFWDAYQENGNRTGYQYAFYGYGWTTETFKPIHSIDVECAMDYGFARSRINGDLVEILEKCGVTINFAKIYNITQMFRDTLFTRLGNLEFTKLQIRSLNYVFDGSAQLETIDKLTILDSGVVTFTNTFTGCTALKNITFGGVIGQNISFADSPLLTTGAEGETTNSVQSIIDALVTITDGVARTLTLHADVRAKLTPEQVNTIKNVKGWSLIPE